MRKYLLRFLIGVVTVIVALVVLVAFDFGFLRGRTPAISDRPTSIASLERIRLGGAEQWILVRGQDTLKPVVLFLHGGPGMPAMYLAHAFQRGLENGFVVVHWDRRGAGKSYAAGLEGEISVRQTLDDTFELTRRLLARFGRQKLYLVGHSWGTYLGMLAIREHPEYYAAFIGIGQISMSSSRVRDVQRRFLSGKARESGNSVLATAMQSDSALISEDDLFRYGAELHGSTNYWPLLFDGLCAPEYTFSDAMNVKKGAVLVNHKMVYNVITGSLAENVREVSIPIFFFLGRYDYATPSDLAAEYLDSISCPLKRLSWFEKSAHFPFYEEPNRFLDEMMSVDSLTTAFWSTATDSSRFSSRAGNQRPHGS